MTEREKVLDRFKVGDLEGFTELNKSNIITDEEDKEELKRLVVINNLVGIGWGEDTLKLGWDIWRQIESDYFDRKAKLLEKYNLLEVE